MVNTLHPQASAPFARITPVCALAHLQCITIAANAGAAPDICSSRQLVKRRLRADDAGSGSRHCIAASVGNGGGGIDGGRGRRQLVTSSTDFQAQ
jgi:hypothetical protein